MEGLVETFVAVDELGAFAVTFESPDHALDEKASYNPGEPHARYQVLRAHWPPADWANLVSSSPGKGYLGSHAVGSSELLGRWGSGKGWKSARGWGEGIVFARRGHEEVPESDLELVVDQECADAAENFWMGMCALLLTMLVLLATSTAVSLWRWKTAVPSSNPTNISGGGANLGRGEHRRDRRGGGLFGALGRRLRASRGNPPRAGAGPSGGEPLMREDRVELQEFRSLGGQTFGTR